MKKQKVVGYANLPTRPPLTESLVFFLLVRVYDVPMFWCGLMAGFLFLYWLAVLLVIFFGQETMDIFREAEE